MVIEINKDIEKYQENVVMGLTAKQLLFSILSLLSGGLIVLLAYQRFGLTISCYLAVPVAAPIALGGFYQYNDMDFYEMLRRYLQSLFYHKVLLYIATEYKDEMEERKAEHLAGHQNDRKVKRRKRSDTRKAHKG